MVYLLLSFTKSKGDNSVVGLMFHLGQAGMVFKCRSALYKKVGQL